MRLQTKVILFLLPSVILSLTGLGFWSMKYATQGIRESARKYMEGILETYVSQNIGERYTILKNNRLDTIPSFVSLYQKEAGLSADTIQLIWPGHIFAFNDEGKLLFDTLASDTNKMEARWEGVVKEAVENKMKALEGSLGRELYRAIWFTPWNWLVFVAVTDDRINEAENRIRLATFFFVAGSGIFIVLLLSLTFRWFLLRPISVLRNSAADIAVNRQIVSVPIQTQDELGILARDIENMSREIHNYQIDLIKLNEELEDLVEKRTEELRKSNEELKRENIERRSAQEALKESEERFRAIFESSEDYIYVLDRKHRYLFVNQAALDPLGIDREDIIGKTASEVFDHFTDLLKLWEERVDSVFSSQASLRVEDTISSENGEIHSESVLFPIKDAQGDIFAVGIIFRDMTERKRMERAVLEASKLNEAIISASSLGIQTWNTSGRSILVNESAAKIMNVPYDWMADVNFYELKSWKETGLLQAAKDVLENGSEISKNVHMITRRGLELWLDCRLARFYWSGNPHLLLIFEDISERITMQKELEARNLELERSNKELDDFAYIASHDLREPLRGITNYSTFLMEDYGDLLDDEGLSKLETLVRLSSHQDNLIRSLLEYSRVGRTDPILETIDLNAVIEEIKDSFSAGRENETYRIHVPRPLPNIVCDRIGIQKVFENLISNALKYNTQEEKLIEIGYHTNDSDGENLVLDNVRKKDSNSYVFYVRDNGIGIKEKHLDKIFTIFKRLHGRDKYGGGTGAGLTIVKKIIERHEGEIWVQSEYGEGTTFYFTLQGDSYV